MIEIRCVLFHKTYDLKETQCDRDVICIVSLEV